MPGLINNKDFLDNLSKALAEKKPITEHIRSLQAQVDMYSIVADAKADTAETLG